MENTLLNLVPASYLPEVHLSQYDVGRELKFTLKDGSSDYSVPSGAVVTVKATKPSGLGFVVNAVADGNIVTLSNTETMTNENGRFPAELSITQGSTVIGTSNFIFNIERSPHPEGTIDGDAESLLPELTLLVERIENSNARIESMTASATTLATGEDATAEYNPVNNQLVLGLPRGEKGEQGEGVASLEPRVSTNENAINVLDARMDTFASLPSGSTSGNAELLDIRVGTDGTTYPSAGDAVRAQISTLNRIVTKGETIDEYADFTLIDEKVINANRVIIDGTPGYCITEPISVIAGEKYKISGFMNWGNYLYVFYDTNGVAFGGVNSENTQAGTTLTDAVITIPFNAVSMRIGAIVNDYHDLSFKKITSLTVADKLSIYRDVDVTLIEAKVINENREVVNGYLPYYITEPIPVIAGETYKLTANENWKNYLYIFYDSNNIAFGGLKSENTNEGTTLTDAVITIPSNAVSIRLGAYIDEQHPFSFKKSTIVNADKLVTQKWEGKKWLIVGDSFTENNATADKKYHKIISDITGIQVLNYGKSGTGYAKTYSTFENFRDRVLTLGSVDCDIITIAGSMNDISAGLDVGNADDTGTATLAGYINATLDNLYSVRPFVQVGIILPLPIQGCTPNDTSDQGIKAIKYCNVLKEIAEKRSIPVCDLFHNSNLHPNYSNFRDEYYYNVDGVHPNNKGHAKFAPKVLDFLEQIIEL